MRKLFLEFLNLMSPSKNQGARNFFKTPAGYDLRLNYDLNENSVIVDVGGYLGQWSSDIFSMYQSHILVFEPVPQFATGIKERFKRNKKIKVFELGLGSKDNQATIGIDSDRSSLFKEGVPISIRIVDATNFLKSQEIEGIDLMKINIEGGEYDLLKHLIETGFIKKIKNIQVQFHDFVPHAQEQMGAIHQLLTQTHSPTYQYPFVWENWTIKT